MKKIDLAAFPTPYFVVDEARLRHNLAILKGVCERTGCKILLAQKAFSMFAAYPVIREYLAGTTASRASKRPLAVVPAKYWLMRG